MEVDNSIYSMDPMGGWQNGILMKLTICEKTSLHYAAP